MVLCGAVWCCVVLCGAVWCCVVLCVLLHCQPPMQSTLAAAVMARHYEASHKMAPPVACMPRTHCTEHAITQWHLAQPRLTRHTPAAARLTPQAKSSGDPAEGAVADRCIEALATTLVQRLAPVSGTLEGGQPRAVQVGCRRVVCLMLRAAGTNAAEDAMWA